MTSKVKKGKPVPTQPFRILDAPCLRDDFYYSILAYSPTSGFLAVGLCHRVYLWSETRGVQHPPFRVQHQSNFVTSLSFSSENGGKSILAVGRRAGMLSLWSTFDTTARFEISHPSPIVCVSFKPTKSRRPSKRFPNVEVNVEDLAVGDEHGNVWYYSVEWPDSVLEKKYNWNGAMTLLAKISAHTQKVCGLAWSPDNIYLATGGNDNCCLLFDLREIIPVQEIQHSSQSSSTSQQPKNSLYQDAFSCLASKTATECLKGCDFLSHFISSLTPYTCKPSMSLLNYTGSLLAGKENTVSVPPNCQKHRLNHSAAVKAIAFAPWQASLLATGGGTNDRAIHFYHTPSGSCLATINVYAQVTSLIWSKTRREIAATLGFAQPEHPYRIAVFSWPSCEQIAAIPWGPGGASWSGVPDNSVVNCGRALYAISYPGHQPFRKDEEDHERPSFGASRSGGGHENEHAPRAQGATSMQPKAKEGGIWCSRTMEEGCIIVVSSDQSIKFHEVWSGTSRKTAATGTFGGSQILEGLEAVERPCNEIIR